MMIKITDIQVFVTNPGRNYVTVKISTNSEHIGLGDATLNGREMAVAAYLSEHVGPCLIGRNVHDIEDIWNYLYKGAYWRKGPVTMAAIAAIDIALWDIKGKICNQPVYNLLGGKSRSKILTYGHANGNTKEETKANVERLISQGYKVIRVQCAIPSHNSSYGALGDKKDYFELQSSRPLPPEQIWDTNSYFNFIIPLFEEIRKNVGYEIELTHDVHNRLTPIEGARLAKELEPFKLFFLEDPVIIENQESYKIIKQHSTTPIAAAEAPHSIWEVKSLIENNWVDYLRMAVTHCGGITALKKIAYIAELNEVKLAPHGPPDISPIGHAAQAHLNLWCPNFGIQEFVGLDGAALGEVFSHPMKLEGGYLTINDDIGLGVSFNEEAAAKFEYKRSYLPVARLTDGTIWNW